MSDIRSQSSENDMYGFHDGSYGLMPKARQEIFHHHTYDLIKKQDAEIARLQALNAKLTCDLDQQMFNNRNNLSIDQKIADQIEYLKEANTLQGLKLTIATTALECIEDPRKMNHSERDDYTQKACLMNVAHVALKVMRGEHVEL